MFASPKFIYKFCSSQTQRLPWLSKQKDKHQPRQAARQTHTQTQTKQETEATRLMERIQFRAWRLITICLFILQQTRQCHDDDDDHGGHRGHRGQFKSMNGNKV